MTRYRLPALALIVTALVAVVALVAHGRPLAASAGHGGLPMSFWDYFLTSAIILIALVWLVVLATALTFRPEPAKRRRPSTLLYLRTLLGILVLGVFFAYFWRHLDLSKLHPNPQEPPPGTGNYHGLKGGKDAAAAGPHFLWIEAMIVFGVLVVAVAIFAATRPRKKGGLPAFPAAPEAVAAALDESLDDLRTDPDLRRAIVAAYARMERALGVAELPRRPAEAPLEYMERALLALDTSGPSVRRLTDLFEWARFSQHEPEPSMRDEAVDALEAVRDELRAPAKVAA